ncbi:MAG TPA: OmpA family protein [Polyangia bacterium]|nr:OmpA family protein [Polyangia bacterium]
MAPTCPRVVSLLISSVCLIFLVLAGVPVAHAAPKSAPAASNSDDDAPDKSDAKSEADAEAEADKTDSEPKDFRFEFGLFGGYYWFTKNHGLGRNQGDSTDLSPADAPLFGGRLSLNFNPWVSVELEANGSPTHTRDRQTDMWVFGYRGQLLVNLVAHGPFRPFLVVGYGAVTSVVKDTSIVPSDTDGMVHGGLGFKILFGDHVGLRLEGRITGPPSFASSLASIGDETGFGGWDFMALGSLYLTFGEVERPRRVVIQRVKVIEKNISNVSSDPDGDGIAGAADKCPDLAEDKDGFEDEDGCPDPDNDKDGIPDLRDKCPNLPEDKDGFEDEDGCPDPDNDNDGIPDIKDKCPNQPETKNGFQDDDGCPDEVPKALARFTGVIEGINFKTGSADITFGSFGILDRAAQVMTQYPDISIEISGHTDNRGSADFNRALSARRAEAVKNYLVSKGIRPERLSSIGYGMDRPVASNKTDSGRARNRRTEFRLITAPAQ